jgi:hypothetical protein
MRTVRADCEKRFAACGFVPVLLAAAVWSHVLALPALGAERDLALERQLRDATGKVNTEYCKDLANDVEFAVGKGLEKEAKDLLAKVKAVDPDYRGLARLEKRVAAVKAAANAEQAAKDLQSLDARVKKADALHAKKLMSLAKQCMGVGLFTRAYDLVLDVSAIDPDNAEARAALGFKRDPKSKAWVRVWEHEMRYGKTKHFLTLEGWFEEKRRKDFEEGKRPWKGKWISQDEEAKIRQRNLYDPYTVESEHFRVETNLGRGRAWEFALLLEDFYGEFFRVFLGYFDQKEGAKLFFNTSKRKDKHLVVLFPSHKDYLTHVKDQHGNDELLRNSAGFYSPADRRSRFFWSEDLTDTLRTFYHEVAHQLFAEVKDGTGGGSAGNNWLVEGIAVYMESWEKVDGRWRPGHRVELNRFQAAKSFLASNPGWSLESFAAIDHDQFHKQNRGLNYALAGALSHFFMHYDDETYKEAFVRFIAAYYAGKVNQRSLQDYIRAEGGSSQSFATLEKQFRQYMASLGEKKAEAEPEAEEKTGG